MLTLFRYLLKLSSYAIIIGLCLVIYLIYYFSRDLPNYTELANYHPPAMTRVYSKDGKLIEEYAKERRIFVPINSIPHSLIEAFIAAEDRNFYEHPGFDIFGIVRAAISNFSSAFSSKKRIQGASTITQQVVKNFFLTSERSYTRKIKEAILSYMMSKTFSKQQILELYLNQIFLGRGAYGVAAAAQVYFNKSIEELELHESALLAAFPQAPSSLNPEHNYKRAKQRRDYVLYRMYEDNYISKNALQDALKHEIVLKKRDKSETINAPYYAEQVRNEAIQLFGKDAVYTEGFTIITPLDTKLQKLSEESLKYGIEAYDFKRGYRGPLGKISLENWKENLSLFPEPEGLLDRSLAVVLENHEKTTKIGLKNGKTGKLHLEDLKWTRTVITSTDAIFKPGDVIMVADAKSKYLLRQIPEVNGAIIVTEPSSGNVLAMVGGYDFKNSPFNRATQAQRQPGSLFKPLVYLAALENGIAPNTIFSDSPIALSQGPGMPMWKPKNYKGDFLGPITMRTGLEKSRNLITIRVAQQIGLNKIAEITKRLGVNSNPPKYYSMVLGAIETTLHKITNAYAILANGGYQVKPHFIEMIKDRNGKIIYRRDDSSCSNCLVSDSIEDASHVPLPEPTQHHKVLVDERSSYQINSILEGVVQRGTASTAKKLGPNIHGKTGSTNDSMDTWFVGFTPDIVVGTYIGYDTPKTLGKSATGANTALPIFIHFMEQALKGKTTSPMRVPEGITLISVDPKTGLPFKGQNAILEAFKEGTEPIITNPSNQNQPEEKEEDILDPTGEIY